MIDRGPNPTDASLAIPIARVTERMADALNSLKAAKRTYEQEPTDAAGAWLEAANREAEDALAQAEELGIEPTHQGGAS